MPPASFSALPTANPNDFGECFFGQVGTVVAARDWLSITRPTSALGQKQTFRAAVKNVVIRSPRRQSISRLGFDVADRVLG